MIQSRIVSKTKVFDKLMVRVYTKSTVVGFAFCQVVGLDVVERGNLFK